MLLQFAVLLSLPGFSSQEVFYKSDIAFRIKGQVVCDKELAPNVAVQLWDRNKWVGNSVHLNSTITDSKGHYEISGTVHAHSFSPMIKIVNHTCLANPGCFLTSYYVFALSFSDYEQPNWEFDLKPRTHLQYGSGFCKH
ncbi:unnamed protein product [Caenorhabditis angaria]|uniref:Transthyretin-like family protein n=1 Tax=Caenorhabditis angaria TaxID=860376 RepID=A0A9P1N155_9PELO|nr:unnamed protein product [Caenorhabditis angaria]